MLAKNTPPAAQTHRGKPATWTMRGYLDLDLFDNPASTIASIHAAGKRAICYFSAGTYEDWRPDASSFDSSSLGAGMSPASEGGSIRSEIARRSVV